jgi:flagellar biosynthesis protein FliQ
MTEGEGAAALREAMIVAIRLGGPPLLASLAAGLIVSVIQSVTQISESSLAFLPKLVAVALVLSLLGPFMVATLTDNARTSFARIASLGAAP